jgi:hypothetical protein
VYPQEVREEEVGVVTPEVSKELRGVFVETQELADDLDGEDLRVGERRRSGSACSEAPEIHKLVVYKAEDGYDEGALRSKTEDLRYVWCYWADTG